MTLDQLEAELRVGLSAYDGPTDEALSVAIAALKELQRYREREPLVQELVDNSLCLGYPDPITYTSIDDEMRDVYEAGIAVRAFTLAP